MERELQKLGLSEKEAKVYLASLELGPSVVQLIARKAGVNRATTYVMIESLIKKGLMSSFEKGKKRFFTAEPPEQLLAILRKQESEIKEKEKSLEELLPELRALFAGAEEKPRVRFFEGLEGLKALQNDILNSKFSSLEEFVALDECYRILPPGEKDHRQKIAEKTKDIPVRVIYTTSKGKILPQFEGKRERRFVPLEKFPFTTEINIYGSKVAIASCKGKVIGVIIENKDIADALRAFFNLAWEAAEKYQ
jgi:sugar-specific transcriptional regulator TrmB